MRPCAFRSLCRTCTYRATRQSAHNTVEHICAATGQLHPYDQTDVAKGATDLMKDMYNIDIN